jgi:Tfp pilus assembly protein PilF
MAGFALMSLRRRPLAAFGLLWLLVGLLPESGIAPIESPRADRYLYLPCAGYVMVAASVLVTGFERLGVRLGSRDLARRVFAAALVLVCVVYGSLAFARNRVWHDEVTLWEYTLREQPHSLRAQIALMSEYLRRGRLEDAARVGRTASSEHPRSWQLQLNLGQVFVAQGRPRLAVGAFTRAAELGGADQPRLVDNLAIAHLKAGDPERVIELLRRGVERWPRDAPMQLHCGQVAFELGDHALAARALEAAVELAPDDAEAHHLLARSHLWRGAVDAAREAVDRALAIAPEHARARRLAARIERRQGLAPKAPPKGSEER